MHYDDVFKVLGAFDEHAGYEACGGGVGDTSHCLQRGLLPLHFIHSFSLIPTPLNPATLTDTSYLIHQFLGVPIPAARRAHPTTMMYLKCWVRLTSMLATRPAGLSNRSSPATE
jgi:hypothetical protein